MVTEVPNEAGLTCGLVGSSVFMVGSMSNRVGQVLPLAVHVLDGTVVATSGVRYADTEEKIRSRSNEKGEKGEKCGSQRVSRQEFHLREFRSLRYRDLPPRDQLEFLTL